MTCDELQKSLLSGETLDAALKNAHLDGCLSCRRFVSLQRVLREEGAAARGRDLSVFRQEATRTAAYALLQARNSVEHALPASGLFAFRTVRLGLGLAAVLCLIALASRFWIRSSEDRFIATTPGNAPGPEALDEPMAPPVPSKVDPQMAWDGGFPPMPIDWPPPEVETRIVASQDNLNFEVKKFRQNYQSTPRLAFDYRSDQLTARIQRFAARLTAELDDLGNGAGAHRGRPLERDLRDGFVKHKEEHYDAFARHDTDHDRDDIAFSHSFDPS